MTWSFSQYRNVIDIRLINDILNLIEFISISLRLIALVIYSSTNDISYYISTNLRPVDIKILAPKTGKMSFQTIPSVNSVIVL